MGDGDAANDSAHDAGESAIEAAWAMEEVLAQVPHLRATEEDSKDWGSKWGLELKIGLVCAIYSVLEYRTRPISSAPQTRAVSSSLPMPPRCVPFVCVEGNRVNTPQEGLPEHGLAEDLKIPHKA